MVNERMMSLTKGSEHIVEIILIHKAIAVLVDHVEGLLELGDLRLVEHGKHVAGSALGTLLSRATTAGCFAGGHVGVYQAKNTNKIKLRFKCIDTF